MADELRGRIVHADVALFDGEAVLCVGVFVDGRLVSTRSADVAKVLVGLVGQSKCGSLGALARRPTQLWDVMVSSPDEGGERVVAMRIVGSEDWVGTE